MSGSSAVGSASRAAASPGTAPADDTAAVPAGAAAGAPPRTRRRPPEWLVTLGVGVAAWVIGAIPYWRERLFYYVGDQYEQFAPLWHVFGQRLRNGEWVTMDPAAWMGGNYAAEGLNGIWNPVSLANFVLVSYFDDLAQAAAVVMVEFLGLLAMGTFLLAREHGARRWPAAVVALAVPFSGFTLWYEAAGWPAGLMAFTWVTWFWWAARRHARGRLNPIVPFLAGALVMTTGNPYGALGMVVVLTALGVELLLRRRFTRLLHLVVMGACAGLVALPVYLPLLGAGDVSLRQDLAVLANDTFLVPDLGDLAAASSPTYLPSITNWGGALLETQPSTYLAWFVLPLLPWLRWSRLRRRARSLAGLLGIAGFYLLATLAPSNLWLFRWPVRLVEYLYLAVAVIFAVVLSAGLATDSPRRRAVASGAIVLGGTYLAWAVRPAGLLPEHAAALLLVAAGTALAVAVGRRWGLPGLGAVLVAGTVAVVAFQTTVLPFRPDGFGLRPASDLTALAAGTTSYEGTVLQLARHDVVTTEQMRGGEITFGNLVRPTGTTTVASYSGIGFQEFADELCTDYRGATCPEAFDRLWQPAGPDYPVPLVDALRVSTLVLQRDLLGDDVVDRQQPPPGWQVAERSPVRAVWVRDEPYADAGRVSWTSPGIEVLADDAEEEREVVRYTADDAGRVLFARLAWPGYTATVDGEEVPVLDGPAGLLAVPVPAGEHTLVLDYAPPGLRAGAFAAAGAALVVLVQAGLWSWQRHRGRRRLRAR
ncbi:YfhO family protein [Blastococcus sp. SYSU DS0619]